MSHLGAEKVVDLVTRGAVDGYNPPRIQTKCRIPMRLNSGMQKSPIRRGQNNPEHIVCNVVQKVKHDNRLTQRSPRTQIKGNRPRSTESRPKSSGRSREREDSLSGSGKAPQQHNQRPIARRERFPLSTKKSVTQKKVYNCYPHTIAPDQRQLQKIHKLPDQDTINKFEDMELRCEYTHVVPRDKHEDKSGSLDIKLNWHDKIVQFEKMKSELDQRQKDIMELYATLRNTHKMMLSLGQQASLPSAEDLRIMNVAKLTPDQLLQLCTGTRFSDDSQLIKGPISIDMNKLYDMPTKLVATCEQTLIKRKEIIDWFETLKTEEKGVSKNKLVKKINEFNAENEMLNCSLQTCKTEFLKELNEIVDCLRRGVNETIALQLRTEELTYEMSELNSQNADLRKQVHAAEHLKSQNNRHRIEELERELRDERCKKATFKDRMTRAETQLKSAHERITQLEAALEIARSQNWTIERTVQQLHEQNQKLQMDFDKELNNLTESIKNNTTHLEEIAEAREKLQTEKEDLEKRLKELSDNYTQSLGSMKEELKANVAKLAETQQYFEEEKDERKKLETKLEELCTKLLESEMRYKEVLKQLQEKDSQLARNINIQTELEIANQQLESARMEIEDYRSRLTKQTNVIKEIERNFKDTVNLEKDLRNEIRKKDENISELEKRQTLLERQLQENEKEMEIYKGQLSSLKNHLGQFQENFGEFENMDQLHDILNQQRIKLLETTRQNGELAAALQKKDAELKNHLEHYAEQESLLAQRDGDIKMLTDKDEEQTNIIKLLRTNLEIRIKAETDITQQLAEKEAEIESLVTNVDTRKQQISQLEKIILTLEDQLRKIHLQRRKDQEKMNLLEKAVTDYEYFNEPQRTVEAPVDNLDNLIKILEDELGTTFEPKQDIKAAAKKRYADDRRKQETLEFLHKEHNVYQSEQDKMPTKILMKKPYQSVHEETDNLDRKKAITSIDTQKWLPNSDQSTNAYSIPDKSNLPQLRGIIPIVYPKDQSLAKNLQFAMNNQREDKKCKMFKLAGHKL